MRAADYVIGRLKAEGLQPAGVHGYLQPVALEQQVVDQVASRAELVGPDGTTAPLKVGDDILITAGGGPRPAAVDAPLVFIGYGLHLPKQGHDDFAGQDLKGKIVVVLSGGPADISGAVKSNARFERNQTLGKTGRRRHHHPHHAQASGNIVGSARSFWCASPACIWPTPACAT